jgi:hypothetical protein
VSENQQRTNPDRRKAMDDDLKRLDDTTLLLMRQAAADNGDADWQRALDAEVIRRTAIIRAQLGGGR